MASMTMLNIGSGNGLLPAQHEAIILTVMSICQLNSCKQTSVNLG